MTETLGLLFKVLVLAQAVVLVAISEALCALTAVTRSKAVSRLHGEVVRQMLLSAVLLDPTATPRAQHALDRMDAWEDEHLR